MRAFQRIRNERGEQTSAWTNMRSSPHTRDEARVSSWLSVSDRINSIAYGVHILRTDMSPRWSTQRLSVMYKLWRIGWTLAAIWSKLSTLWLHKLLLKFTWSGVLTVELFTSEVHVVWCKVTKCCTWTHLIGKRYYVYIQFRVHVFYLALSLSYCMLFYKLHAHFCLRSAYTITT